MKKIYAILIISLAILNINAQNIYDSELVEFSSVTHENEKYQLIKLVRNDDKRIRAKYFASDQKQKIKDQYLEFARSHNVICYSSGAYMDDLNADNAGIIGINIDNGVIVNRSFPEQGGLDALVIVYTNGGVAVSNLDEGNLTLSGGSAIYGKKYDIRGNSMDYQKFLRWAEEVGATVFQTHLLAWKNKLDVGKYNSNATAQERRFLAIGYDEFGNPVHCIVNKPKAESLYISAEKVLNFLSKNEFIDVIALCNLDTGAQNVVQLYTPSGKVNTAVKSTYNLNSSRNLLVYYYH